MALYFTLYKVYTTAPSIKPYMPQSISYNSCPRDLGVVSTLEELLFDLWTVLTKKAISKLKSDVFGEKRAW